MPVPLSEQTTKALIDSLSIYVAPAGQAIYNELAEREVKTTEDPLPSDIEDMRNGYRPRRPNPNG